MLRIALKQREVSAVEVGRDDSDEEERAKAHEVVQKLVKDSFIPGTSAPVLDVETVASQVSFEFHVTRENWSRFRRAKRPHLLKGWTEFLAREFKKRNPHCVLKFEQNHISSPSGQKKNCASFQRNGVLQHIILQSLLHLSDQQQARRRWRSDCVSPG